MTIKPMTVEELDEIELLLMSAWWGAMTLADRQKLIAAARRGLEAEKRLLTEMLNWRHTLANDKQFIAKFALMERGWDFGDTRGKLTFPPPTEAVTEPIPTLQEMIDSHPTPSQFSAVTEGEQEREDGQGTNDMELAAPVSIGSPNASMDVVGVGTASVATTPSQSPTAYPTNKLGQVVLAATPSQSPTAEKVAYSTKGDIDWEGWQKEEGRRNALEAVTKGEQGFDTAKEMHPELVEAIHELAAGPMIEVEDLDAYLHPTPSQSPTAGPLPRIRCQCNYCKHIFLPPDGSNAVQCPGCQKWIDALECYLIEDVRKFDRALLARGGTDQSPTAGEGHSDADLEAIEEARRYPNAPDKSSPTLSAPQGEVSGLVEQARHWASNSVMGDVTGPLFLKLIAALQNADKYAKTQDNALRFYSKRHELDRTALQNAEKNTVFWQNEAGRNQGKVIEAQAIIDNLRAELERERNRANALQGLVII